MLTLVNDEKCVQEVLKELSEMKHQPSKEEVGVIFKDAEIATKKENTEFFDKTWINHQLFPVLSPNLTDTALNTIKSLQDEESNGLIGRW